MMTEFPFFSYFLGELSHHKVTFIHSVLQVSVYAVLRWRSLALRALGVQHGSPSSSRHQETESGVSQSSRVTPIVPEAPTKRDFPDPLTLGERYELRVPLWLETSWPPGAHTPVLLYLRRWDSACCLHPLSVPTLWSRLSSRRDRRDRISSVRRPNVFHRPLSHF